MSRYLPTNVTIGELEEDIRNGGRFVFFTYTISIVVMTFKRSSKVQYVPAGKSGLVLGLPYTLLSLLLGWWGIPWGPIYTIGSLITNLGGGKDVTDEILPSLQAASFGSMTSIPMEA